MANDAALHIALPDFEITRPAMLRTYRAAITITADRMDDDTRRYVSTDHDSHGLTVHER